MPSTAKQRKKEEEGGLSWRWFESTAQRWPWLCSVWWRLRPRLWGLHVTLASSLLPFPLLPTVRNAAVPSHAVQCHPGKSELCLAPFILLQWPEGLYQGASSLATHGFFLLLLLFSFHANGIAFSLSFSLNSQTNHAESVARPSYNGEYYHNCCYLSFAGLVFCFVFVLFLFKLNVAPVKMSDTVLQL